MIAVKQLFSIVALSAFLTVASADANCTRNGTVQRGDTCDGLSARLNVSTFQLARVNKGIDCSDLFIGQVLCLGHVGEDCTNTTVVKQPVDSCSPIADAAGIPVSTLLANNGNIFSNCINAYSSIVLCVAKEIINYS